MKRPRSAFSVGLVVLVLAAGAAFGPARAQDAPAPPALPAALGDDLNANPRLANPAVALADDDNQPVKPLVDGPLHEAFLSPAKDGDPAHVEKAPPPPIQEHPGVDRPSADAQWIEGYWGWDNSRKDFVWVTGTWRVAPPGRFWVNGYWKRDEKGWFRVAGFWSDRQTDRIDWRKTGPPNDRPRDDPGPSPGDNYFYIPGQYFPDGNGVVWKPGFWAKVQSGWAWVPAQWVKQPEGYVFQDGYWDRTLEDRGILFSPAQVSPNVDANAGSLVYQPVTQVPPDSYGQLYGAFGRPNSFYDGYPGCYYDPYGRYYGYGQYGNLPLYSGYYDYPYVGGSGYPYLTSNASYGYGPYYYGMANYGYNNFSPYYGGGYGYGYGGGGYGSYGYGLGGLGYGLGYGFMNGLGFGLGAGCSGMALGTRSDLAGLPSGFPILASGSVGFGLRGPFFPGGFGNRTTIINNGTININRNRLTNVNNRTANGRAANGSSSLANRAGSHLGAGIVDVPRTGGEGPCVACVDIAVRQSVAGARRRVPSSGSRKRADGEHDAGRVERTRPRGRPTGL